MNPVFNRDQIQLIVLLLLLDFKVNFTQLAKAAGISVKVLKRMVYTNTVPQHLLEHLYDHQLAQLSEVRCAVEWLKHSRRTGQLDDDLFMILVEHRTNKFINWIESNTIADISHNPVDCNESSFNGISSLY